MGCQNLFLTNQVNNPPHLAFGGMIVEVLRAGYNGSSGHRWPPGLSLPTSVVNNHTADTFGSY